MRALPRPSRITILAVCLAAVAAVILIIGCMRAMDTPDRPPGPSLASSSAASGETVRAAAPDDAADQAPSGPGALPRTQDAPAVSPDRSAFSHMVEPLSARLFVIPAAPAAGEPVPAPPVASSRPSPQDAPAPQTSPQAATPQAGASLAAAPSSPRSEAASQGLAALTAPRPTEPAVRPPDRVAPPAARTVLVVGDSFAVGIGMTLAESLREAKDVRLDQKGKTSSGLDNVKFHNWGKTLTNLLTSAKPDALVIMIGGNDAQNGPGTEVWAENYRQKASDFLGIAAERNVPVYWVALPPMREPSLNAKVKTANAAMRAACESDPNCRFIDSWDLFSDDKGDYAAEKSLGGKTVKLRGNDGVHFTMAGYRLLSDRVLNGFAPNLELTREN